MIARLGFLESTLCGEHRLVEEALQPEDPGEEPARRQPLVAPKGE